MHLSPDSNVQRLPTRGGTTPLAILPSGHGD
jgi:hypothetical protein